MGCFLFHYLFTLDWFLLRLFLPQENCALSADCTAWTLLVYTPHKLQASVYDIPPSGTLVPESELRSVHSSWSKLPVLTLGRLYHSWVLFLRQTLAKNNRLYILIKTSFSAFFFGGGGGCWKDVTMNWLIVGLKCWWLRCICWTGPTVFSHVSSSLQDSL